MTINSTAKLEKLINIMPLFSLPVQRQRQITPRSEIKIHQQRLMLGVHLTRQFFKNSMDSSFIVMGPLCPPTIFSARINPNSHPFRIHCHFLYTRGLYSRSCVNFHQGDKSVRVPAAIQSRIIDFYCVHCRQKHTSADHLSEGNDFVIKCN